MSEKKKPQIAEAYITITSVDDELIERMLNQENRSR